MARHIGKLTALTLAGILGSSSVLVQPAAAASRNIGSILGAIGDITNMVPRQAPTKLPGNKAVRGVPRNKAVGGSLKGVGMPTGGRIQAGTRAPTLSKIQQKR
jgi:hypothetical protein